MISVSSSNDARIELGLGFVGLEEQVVMEESSDDLEEESTHSYVSCVDPDVTLSYIDEKIENVLGHFQKDFEGGVSAENLGAKFGGYGSFLSMYQRSPAACSRPKSPPHVGVRSNCSVVPELSISGSTSKAPASDVSAKLQKFVKSCNIVTPDSKQMSVTKSSSSAPSNHKTLRLRIKVGSSDLSSLKNVSTNSKQGLGLPPPSSRVNCHSEVEEGMLYGICDSPTKIIMAMVSFPLHKDQLLSPLSDDLIQLGRKEKTITKEAGCGSVNKSHSAQKFSGKVSTGKKEKFKERVKYIPSNTENEAEKQSCEELLSETLKLPLLACPSLSHIHQTKEIDKVSDSYIRERNNVNIDAALMGSKPELEDSILSKREQDPSVEHVDHSHSSVVKVSRSETGNEEKILKSKLPKVRKSESSIVATNRLSGKDDTVNIVNKSVPDRLQEGNGVSEDVRKGFFGDSRESKKEKKNRPVLKAGKEKLSEENALKESFNNNEEACNRLHSSDLNEDKHSAKQSVGWEVKNNHSCEGTEKLEMEAEREGSGKSEEQQGTDKILDVVADNKTMIIQPSPQTVKDTAKASSHDARKRKLKENKESGDCKRLSEAKVMESSGEKVKKKRRLKGSSCEGKDLPVNSESYDRDRRVQRETGRDSASHLPFTSSSPGLYKDSTPEAINSNVHEAKCSLVESVAHDANSNGGDTIKRSRDCEGYNTIDKPGTAKKALELSKDHNLVTTGQAIHSSDKKRPYDENCSVEKYKSKKSRRYSGEKFPENESQGKNKEEGSSGPSKDNNFVMVSDVQDVDTAVKVKSKESRSKKRPTRKLSMESNKEESRECQDLDKAKTYSAKSNHLEVTTEKLKNESAAQAGTDQVEVLGNGNETSNTKIQQVAINNSRGATPDVGLGNRKQTGSRHEEIVGLSPLKKESTSQAAANSIKEARDLKHMADRLKNAGSNHESMGVYFQAALKFLQGASLLESSITEHATLKSSARSKDIYGSTAKLCQFCAHEYEKNKDMGAAALAYKCMEVAYLRITYSSHGSISRYGYELQAALQVTPSGESHSFASDGENSNQTLAADKVALSNTVRSSPRVTGNHVISSGNNASLAQLLAFSQNVNLAMDASRKAQMAFAAAKGRSIDTRYSNDGITSIKRALDFNFQDMEKLLHVVKLAMESINR